MDKIIKKTLIKNEYYILLLLYLILVIFILIKIFNMTDYMDLLNNKKIEKFTQQKIKNNNIFSILINIYGPKNIFYAHLMDETLPVSYMGTYFCHKNKCNNSIFTSDSLKLDNWKKFTGFNLPKKGVFPYSITYDTNNDILVNAVDNKMNYSIYRYSDKSKKCTKVISFLKTDEINIMTLLFDIEYNKWLGVNYNNGQIYENDNEDIDSTKKWTPVNVDLTLKIKKIMYDIDGYLIAIGEDNYLYKKNNINWRDSRSRWDKTNINKIKDKRSGKINKFLDIHDVIYDKDRCFIASTSAGIYKQKKPGFDTEFVPILTLSYKDSNEKNLGIHEILKLKTGINFNKHVFDLENIDADLQNAYATKMDLVNLCLNKKRLDMKINPDHSKQDNPNNEISNVNNEIYNLYDIVNKIHSKYKNKNI